MSISSQGGQQRRPGVVSTGKKDPPADSSAPPSSSDSTSAPASKSSSPSKSSSSSPSKSSSSKSAASGRKSGASSSSSSSSKAGAAKTAAGKRPGGAKGGGPRRPITPVKVSQGRSWGPIALFVAVGLIAAGIIGWGAYAVYENGRSWEDKAAGIDGIVNYRETDPAMLTKEHKAGALQYKVLPPVGGDHSLTWQRCMGDVYDAQIANENAVHSLEHGAVWITYQPELPKDQVDKLASKVRGNDFMLMSPFPGLDKPISLQAWGYQLKVDNADDGRIDDFVTALRQNASLEPGAVCSAGNYTTGTGTTPRDLSDQQGTGGG